MKEKLLSLTINTQGFETVIKNAGSKKSKTYRGLKSQINHNNRTEEMDEDYLVNEEMTKDNKHLIIKNLDTTIEKWIEEMEQDYFNYYKRKMPKNTKPFINGLITFSEEMQEDIKKFGAAKMTETIKSFLIEEYGNKLISLDLHLDETTPHFHFQVLNYDFNLHKTHSRILETRLRDKENKERRNITQDNLANYLQNNINDFDYKRGIIQSTREYHNKKKAQSKVLKNQKTKISELENQLSVMTNKNIQLEKENEILTQQKTELENEVENLEEEIQDIFKIYESDINELVEDLTELNEEMEIKEFYKKALRYLKNENQKALQKLIQKMNRKTKAMKKKSNSIMR